MFSSVPLYYIKVIKLDGTVVAAPLETAAVEFTDVCYVLGQSNLGEFKATLRDTRDPRWFHLRDTYNLLNYEQRVEIYQNPDCVGTPVFSGVLTRLPDSLERMEIAGQGILRRLETRRLRRYHELTGNAATVATSLLKTYNVVFKDDFTNLSNWSAGTWSAVNHQAITTGMMDVLETSTIFTQANWNISKTSFDFSIPSATNWNSYGKFDVYVGYDETKGFVSFHLEPGPGGISAGLYTFQLYESNQSVIATRDYPVSADVLYHFDIYLTLNGSNNYDIRVTLNGLQLLTASTTGGNINHAGTLRFVTGDSNVTTNFKLANVVLTQATPALTAGTVDTTAVTIDQVFNGDTNLAALNWIMNYLDWEYRVVAAAGAGNDTIDIQSSVGTDLSSTIILEEGKNIIDLRRDRTNQNLATSLYVYGQAQDDISANFISNSLANFDTFGIVEADFNDPKVVDTATAKLMGDNRLATMSTGNVSLSGTVVDESALFEQSPIIGWMVIGDSIIGGRQHLRAGDSVWLKSTTLNINKKVKIVGITRTSGSPAVKLTFDYFPWKQSKAFDDLYLQYWELRRAFINRMNAQTGTLTFSTTGTQNWYIYLRGQIQSVYLDVRIRDGSPTYTVLVDGTDRTSAIFGAASLTSDAHATDTTYLVLSGNHVIGINVSAGTGTFDLSVQTRVLS